MFSGLDSESDGNKGDAPSNSNFNEKASEISS